MNHWHNQGMNYTGAAVSWPHQGMLGTAANSHRCCGRNFIFSKRTWTHLSNITHNYTSKLFGPNCLINKNVRFVGFYFVWLVGWLVWYLFDFSFLGLETPWKFYWDMGTVNQERKLGPRASVLEPEVELASPRLCGLTGRCGDAMKTGRLVRKQRRGVWEAAPGPTMGALNPEFLLGRELPPLFWKIH